MRGKAAGLVVAALAMGLAGSSTPATAQSADAKMKANLRNLAVDEETYFTDHSHYGTAQQLKAAGYHLRLAAGQVINVHVNAMNYCLAGRVSPDRFFLYASDKGGLYGPRHKDVCDPNVYPRSSGHYSG